MINAVRFRFYKGFSLRIVLLFLLLFLFQNSFGQNPANIVPEYDWIDDVSLPNVTVTSLNSEDINIAVATGPENYVYILTFGNGVQRRNADGTGKIDQFINGLDSPLDIAVDEKGFIYVADFQAGGETYEDNGKVKVYNSNGVFQYSVLTSYFRPMGIDVDSENLYIAEYNDGEQGPERTPSSRVRIVDKLTGAVKALDKNVTLPYRIAISEKTKHVYVSQAGNSTSSVRIYNQSLSFLGNLAGIQSPGSVIVDSFGFIHVIEYTNRVNFEDFIKLSTDFNLGELLELSHDIRDGVADNAFFIRIYNSSEVLQNRKITDHIDFPIDLAGSYCDKFYVDNSKIFGTHVDNFLTHSFFPSRIEFDLEIYQRTPSADITPPEAICVSDFEITLSSTETRTLTAEDIDDGSNDVCGDVTLAINKDTFTADDEGDNTVTLTVTDEQGNESTCTTIVKVIVEEAEDTVAPEFDCPEAIEVNNDPGVCGAVVNFNTPTATDDSGETPTIIQTEGPASGSEFPVGSTTITFTATDGSNNSSTCSFEIIVTDNEDPVFVCPENITETVPEGESGKVITYELDFSDNCGSVNVERTAGRASGDRFTLGTTRNTFRVTDVNGNTTTCSFDVTITEESPDLEITNCPGPQTFEVDDNCAYRIPNIAAMIETNIAEAEISQNIEAGFEVHGNLTLTITATYEDQTVTCDVSLIADDNIDPTITCPGDQTEIVNEGEGFQLPNYVLQADYDDNCTIASLRQEPDVQTVIYETTDVTLYVVDEAGNESSCTFTVTLEEQNQEILRINCPQNYTVSADENCNYWVPDFSTIVSATIEGATIEQDVLAGSSFDPNSDPYIRVTATYEDQSDYCDIYLLPEDQTDPVARCILEYQVTLDEGETVEIDPENLDGGSSDNCSIASFSLSQTQFTSADEGVQNIQFIVTDSAGNTDECTVAIMVVVNSEGNQAPIANADRYETPMGQTLNVSAENGILVNDSDPDGDELEIVLVSSTNNGSLTLNADGSFQYVPNNGVFGTDTFTYYVTDGELDSETVEVSINVLQGENQQPVVVADQYSTLVNTTLNIDAPGVLSNDYDPEGVELLAFLMDGPSNGTLELQQDGSFTYTPDNGFVGEDRFSYYATDEAGEGVATVTITVVDDSEGYPVANPDSYETDFNTTLTISEQDGILANDSDPNGDELFAVLVDDVSNGQLDLNSDGSFTYTPENGFSGTDSFTYHATDGEFNSGTVTVTITVNPEANTGDFRCAEDVTIFLRDEATYTIDITTLYSGNTDGLTIEASRLTFGCEDVGETELTLTYSGAQNGSCVIPVTVIDRTAPDLQLRDIIIQIGIEGTAEISFEDIDAGSSDLCSDDVTYDLSQTEFNCDDLGDNIVQVTATDNYGNTTTETVIVTVEGENCGNLPPGTEYTFIYPNPNSGSFTVATPSDISIKRIEVFDHRGRFIAAKDFKGDRMEYSMDVGPLQEAAYVLKIKTNKKDLVKRIIIKN